MVPILHQIKVNLYVQLRQMNLIVFKTLKQLRTGMIQIFAQVMQSLIEFEYI